MSPLSASNLFGPSGKETTAFAKLSAARLCLNTYRNTLRPTFVWVKGIKSQHVKTNRTVWQQKMGRKRVCIIGGGPGAMEVLHQLASYSERQPSLDRKEIPEVVCYEKQSCPGGMWNLNWRVGKPRYNLFSDQISFMFFVTSPLMTSNITPL